MDGHQDVEVNVGGAAVDRLADRRGDRLSGRRRVCRSPRSARGLVGSPIVEISCKKGHRYITIVVALDTGRLVWVAPGRDRKTLNAFFTALPGIRCAAVTHVSADAAQWIADEAALNCPNAVRYADAFHIAAGPVTSWTRSAETPGTPPAKAG